MGTSELTPRMTQLCKSIMGLHRRANAVEETNPALARLYRRNRDRCAGKLLALKPDFLLDVPGRSSAVVIEFPRRAA